MGVRFRGLQVGVEGCNEDGKLIVNEGELEGD